MASKFSDFIAQNKLDPRRIIAASHKLEKLRPEDRALRLKRRTSKEEAASGAEDGEKAAPTKPRSGRPVTTVLLKALQAGKQASGPAKTRVLRALNHVLEQKKKDPVDAKALF